MFFRGFLVVLILGSALGDEELSSGARLLMKAYEDCQQKGFVDCLKMKAITFFDRAARAKEFDVGEAFKVVREEGAVEEGEVLTEAALEASLPRGEDARDSRLNTILFNRVADFFNTHKVVLGLPKLNPAEIQTGVEEGRGKMKKMMSMMMMGFAMKLAAVVPLAIGLLFLLAGKALIISKIALVLTLVIALKKLLSQKHGHGHGHDSGWQSSGGWDKRSYTPVQGAQEMAYRAQLPMTNH